MYKILLIDEIQKKHQSIIKADKDFKIEFNGIYYVVKENDKIIGYILVTKENNIFKIERIFVREEYRYTSYGKNLLKFLIGDSITKNINKIIVEDISLFSFFKKYGFIKENKRLILDNIQEKSKRLKDGKKVVILSILQNIILAILKIFGGIYGSSRALISDGINSLADVGSSLAIYFGLYMSNKPADKEHPYGHEKIESIIATIMGIFLILTAFELMKSSSLILYSGKYSEIPSKLTILWAGISMISKIFMYKYKMKIGTKTQNLAIVADAKDSKSDAYSSAGVIIGIILSIYISPIFDIIMSILVGGLIFKEGISIIFENSDIILDKQDKNFINEIRNYILKNNKITNVHDIYMRKSGDKLFISLHIRVPKDMTVGEAHKISENISQNIKLDFPNVVEVTIHLDIIKSLIR